MRTVIRRAQQNDIEPMIYLFKYLFTIEKDFVFNEEKQRRGLEMMMQDQENRCVFIAEMDGQVVGMITGQTLVSTAEGGLSVFVEDLVIDQSHRGRGIGTELLKVVESWSKQKGARRMQLMADVNNTPAFSFYRKLDWTGTSLRCMHKKGLQD